MRHRAAIKFCFLLGRSAANAVNMLPAIYKEHVLKRIKVFEWYLRFKRGDMSFENDQCPGGPSTPRTDENVDCDLLDHLKSTKIFSVKSSPRMNRGVMGTTLK